LAKVAKYQIDFKSGDDQDCQITFLFEGWAGGITTLEGGARPFVLREFNSDDDIFKPIRAMLAEMEIVTNVNGVKIEDFYAAQDSDILVRFSINTFPYWRGYVLQDDFQEVWDDTNHYLIIRAADGFGLLKNFQFGDGDNELVGKFTPFNCLAYAMSRLPEVPLIQHYVINNLYHDSMSDAVQTMPLDQCYIDAKTFQQEGTTYDDCYTAIEKINKSFSQTVFMYMGEWWFLRVEELYTSYNNNLRGFFSDLGVRYTIDKRYDVEVGVGREVQPITPELLRLIKKKTKYDEVDFNFTPFNEMLTNESFARATYVSTVGNSKIFSLNDWTFEGGTLSSPTTPAASFTTGLREVYNTTLIGGLLERYIFLQYNGSTGNSSSVWLKSNSIKVFQTNQLNFSIDIKTLNSPSSISNLLMKVAYVIIESGILYYYLDEEGNWNVVNNLNDCLPIRLAVLGDSNVNPEDWNTVQVESKLIPASGNLTVRLNFTNDTLKTDFGNYFRNLQCKVSTSFESLDNIRKITGINSKFEKTGTIINADIQETYLDDHFSTLHKGAIFQSDGTTLTDQDWYRYRFIGESYGFRRQNATALWEHNRVNRNKIDGNFYGLMWNDGVQDLPIGLINTIRFLDDDVNKVYWIANMREIDFAAGTWSATLEEVYDELRDTPVTTTFEADFTIGTYASPNILPLTIVTAGGFSIQGGNTARYDGATTLSTPIDCSIFGEISATSYPTTISFQLQKNGTSIKTINYPIYVANQPYTLNMSVGTQSIATNDTFRLVVVGASSINVDGGDMKINSPSPSQVYDTYSDNYLYQ
jgi:hypothetical protein